MTHADRHATVTSPVVRSGRIHRAPLLLAGLFTLVVGVCGGAGVYLAADRQNANVNRVNIAEALASPDANTGPAENYVLVGSDSRANFDPDARDGVLEGTDPGCQCSDTLMILRRDPDDGASLLSIPRDLWVDVTGHGEHKINAAYGYGPDTVVTTLRDNFGINIDHYVEIDFAGFVTLVDAIGGVEVCVPNLARDKNTGMQLEAGCHVLNGVDALTYARSRYYEEFVDGDWQRDPRADLGRIERQQQFIESAVNGLLEEIIDNPGRIGDLIDEASSALTVDQNTDLFTTAQALAAAADDGLTTFTLPIEAYDAPDGSSALQLIDSEAQPILDYFRGVGPRPAGAEDSTPATSA